jgi:hypothetical protein
MNNFKIKDGAHYCSKSGSPANDGTINSPKLTIGGMPVVTGSKRVVGTGVYYENADINCLVGDGNVIIDGQDYLKTTPLALTGNGGIVVNVTYTRFSQVQPIAGATQNYILNAVFLDCRYVVRAASSSSTCMFRNCIFIGVKGIGKREAGTYYPAHYYENCIFIECEEVSGLGFENCYVDASSKITVHYGNTALTHKFFNNCINGNFPGRISYQSVSGGAFTDYNNIEAMKAAAPAFTAGSFGYTAVGGNIDPKFNNPEYLDFSLQNDSPLIGSGINGTNVTGQRRAVIFSGVHPIFQNGTLDNIDIDPVSGEIFIGQSGDVGILTSAVYNAGRTRTMGTIGNLGITDLFNNVPDALELANPNHIDFEMRWANGIEDITLNPWRNFRYNEKPQLDQVQKTNGEAGFDWLGGLVDIQYNRLQFRITLRRTFNQL